MQMAILLISTSRQLNSVCVNFVICLCNIIAVVSSPYVVLVCCHEFLCSLYVNKMSYFNATLVSLFHCVDQACAHTKGVFLMCGSSSGSSD